MKLEQGRGGIITLVLQNGQRIDLFGKEALKGKIYTQCPSQTSEETADSIHRLLKAKTWKRLVMNAISTTETQLKSGYRPYIYQVDTLEKARELSPIRIQFMCSIGKEPVLPKADIIIADTTEYALSVFSRTALVFVMSSFDDNNENTAMGVLIRPAILKHFQTTLKELVEKIGGNQFFFSVLSYSGFNYPDGNNVLPAVKKGIYDFCQKNDVRIIPDYEGLDVSIPNEKYYTGDDPAGNNIFLIP